MSKKLLTLLSSLIMVPFLILGAPKDFAPAYADEGEGEGEQTEVKDYPYTEGDGGYETTTRTYLTTDLSPKLVSKFKAPSGFTLNLSLTDEQIEDIMLELDSVGTYYNWAVCPEFYYHYNTSRVYVDSDYIARDVREGVKEEFGNIINNMVLFSIEELKTDVELQLEMIIGTHNDNGDMNFVFFSDVYTYHPYGETDFVNIETFYYQAEGGSDVRVDVRGIPMSGLIYGDPDYNEDGFHADDGYEITIFGGGVPLSKKDESYVEMSFPKNPFKVYARLRFYVNGELYLFYSEEILVADPCIDILVDGYHDRDRIQKDSEHVFSIGLENFDLNDMVGASISMSLSPYHLLLDDSIEIINDLDNAGPGEEGKLYYHPSDEEKESGQMNQNLDEPAPGEYLIWGKNSWDEEYSYIGYRLDLLFENYYDWEDEYEQFTDDVYDLFQTTTSIPYIGKYIYYYNAHFGDGINRFYLETIKDKFLTVVAPEENTDTISLNVPDMVNLVAGTGSIEIVPTIETERSEEVTYFFDYEVSAPGIIDVSQGENGVLTINPLSYGVTYLTVYEECRLYSRISKTITIRVLDAVLDVSTVEISDENHYAGQDLTAYVNVRGFTSILNLDIDWTVLDKDGSPLDEAKYVDNKDATLTLIHPEIDNYTISASFEGVEIGSVFFKVRQAESATPSETDDRITLNVSDNVNLVARGGTFDIVTRVETTREEEVEYFYDYELSREGIVDVTENANGVYTINPVNHGVVTLTIYVECELYSRISKTINIRVLDAVLDVSKLEVPDEFHYAGQDLTASVSVRGFTNILNLPIEWTVLDKNGNPLDEEKYVDNKDATLTLLKPESNDYTITASYEGIEIGTVSLQVRQINVNKFVRDNIWWICLITLAFVFFVFLIKALLSRSKSTVQSIQKVYDVFCACLSDDKLTKAELQRIKREINKCLHRCEDLNIEALNQYEKAIRYLRKSLNDSKDLLKKWETITPEEKSTFADKLDKDLSKALNVAKEIENAKELIEAYHTKANRNNYETLKEEKPNDKKEK